MNDEKFNMSMRKFLKQVGVTSQQHIEEAVRVSGRGEGKIPIKVVVTAETIGLNHVIEGEIDLS